MARKSKLHYATVTPLLLEILKALMKAAEFDAFRLVGGTTLSLQRGHRMSDDIDLFTDAEHGTINFQAIDKFLRKTYPYVNEHYFNSMGKSYYIGKDESDSIKLDLFYTDNFIQDVELIDGIRLASVEEIIAMKMDVISRGGRKKDFWDIHELKDNYTLEQMLVLHKERYPYTHNSMLIRNNLTAFKSADKDFDVNCLRNKHWAIVKLDMIDFEKGL